MQELFKMLNAALSGQQTQPVRQPVPPQGYYPSGQPVGQQTYTRQNQPQPGYTPQGYRLQPPQGQTPGPGQYAQTRPQNMPPAGVRPEGPPPAHPPRQAAPAKTPAPPSPPAPEEDALSSIKADEPGLSAAQARQGIILAELLGPPKALRRHRF